MRGEWLGDFVQFMSLGQLVELDLCQAHFPPPFKHALQVCLSSYLFIVILFDEAGEIIVLGEYLSVDKLWPIEVMVVHIGHDIRQEGYPH